MNSSKPTPGSVLRARLGELATELRGAAHSPDDPDAIHDLRVAIRRFGQAVRIFPDVFDHGSAKQIRRRLKKLMSALGEVRNLDIALEILQTAKVEPGRHLLKRMADQRQSAQNSLSAHLNRWQKRDVIRTWKTLLRGRVGGARSFEQARRELPRIAAEFLQAGNEGVGPRVPFRRLHHCRLLGKRLRYSIEIFGAPRKLDMKRGLSMLKDVQDHLGGLSDCVTAIELLQNHHAVRKRVRALLTARETAFRSFWLRTFDTRTQKWWIDWLTKLGE